MPNDKTKVATINTESPPWPLRVSPGFTDLKPQAEDPMLGGFQDLIIMMMMIMIIMIIIFIMINYC